MSGREQALPWGRGFRASLSLGLEGLLGTRRALATALLVGAPLLAALAYRVAGWLGREVGLAPWGLYGDWLVASYWLSLALPLSALFHATAFAEEVENRTIVFLLTRPLPRSALLSGKFAAYALSLLAVSLPALALTFALLASVGGWAAFAARTPALLRDAGVVVLAVLAYGALFTLLGALLRRPAVPGVLFLFGWETLANLPGYLPRLTLAGLLRALLPYQAPQAGLFGLLTPGSVPAAEALLDLGLATLLCLGLALFVFARREYVPEA